MIMGYLNQNEYLDGYILAKELMKKAKISPNAYRFWGECRAAKYDGGRLVFIKRDSVIQKYKEIAKSCTDLDGYVHSQAFCKFSGLSPSNLVSSNNGEIYKLLGIKIVEGVKFVNLRMLLKAFKIPEFSMIYIEKCRYFAPLEKKIKLTKTLCVGYY